MDKINWGIIGCGDVTEVKSGPAFNKINNSALVAVMRRDEAKVKDYAERHNVPKWFTDANALVQDAEVNAVYIATPPSTHKALALMAMAAGKPVYIEKPMAINAAEAHELGAFAKQKNVLISVAHYRRQQPKFKKVRQLLAENIIGEIRTVQLQFFKKALSTKELNLPKNAWRIHPETSGGGLFHDIAPHQLDLLLYYFGNAEKVTGLSFNQSKLYAAADIVSGQILFPSGIIFSGTWCFNVSPLAEKDIIEIVGSKGKISFSVFTDQTVTVERDGGTEIICFDELQHVQQPMIEAVVDYFLGRSENPCSAEEGIAVMEWIDDLTK